jgi:hypothetical protein
MGRPDPEVKGRRRACVDPAVGRDQALANGQRATAFGRYSHLRADRRGVHRCPPFLRLGSAGVREATRRRFDPSFSPSASLPEAGGEPPQRAEKPAVGSLLQFDAGL